MAPRKKRRKRQAGQIAGLVRRGPVYYWDRDHQQLGGRVYKSLGVRDLDTANGYAGSLQKLMDRGDWDVLRRWIADKLHISTIERAVREGDWQSLKKLHQSGPLLGEQVDLFLTMVGATQRRATEKNRRSALKAAVAHFGADFAMHTLTVAEAEDYLRAEHDGQKWQANTQASHVAALAMLWSFTVAREREEAEKFGAEPWLRTNPWRTAKRPKVEQTRFAFFMPAKARELLAHPQTAGTPKAGLLATGFYAGLRRSEMAYLRTGFDVDFERGLVRIQSRGGEHAWKPKTKRSERDIPMIPALREILAEHVALGFAGERFFFRSERHDQPPSSQTVDKWARDSFRAAGVKQGRAQDGLVLHSTRHSFATWQLEHGVPVTIVARLMGDTVETILRTYSHAIPDRVQVAVDLLEALAQGKPGAVTYEGAP